MAEQLENDTPNPAALTLSERGSKGARVRNAMLTAEQRSDIARKGARARNAKLTAKQRSDIARKAAERRWE